MSRSKSITPEAATRLFFTLVPMPQHVCASCGYDPRHQWDKNNQFIVGWDENQWIDAPGRLCRECALDSARFLSGRVTSWRAE